jgi:hypothetical protein
MSANLAQAILAELHTVDRLRHAQAADAALRRRVQAVKAYQHARFGRTHADLLASPRYGAASRFFLDELYGPHDFRARDAQFARVVPALVRLFPAEVVETVRCLASLHALSETLDNAMALALPAQAGQLDADPGAALDSRLYAQAWREVGRAEAREQQVLAVLALGRALDKHTRHPWLRRTLRLMRGPARASGLQALQRFLEAGFDTFAELRGAQEFLAIVSQRERDLIARLFAGDDCL